MSHWNDWYGGECPLDSKARVRVLFRNGGISTFTQMADSWRWSHEGWSTDIVAYLVQSTEGAEQ